MRILVTAATRHGSTGEIARAIAATLIIDGHEVVLAEPERVDSVAGYEAVVVGSAIYAGGWLAPARDFVERHAPALQRLPVWLFSSGPLGESPKPEGEPAGVLPIVERLRPRDHRVFAGRIDKSQLGFAEKAITRIVKAPDGDFRPWPEIEAWARTIGAELGSRTPVLA
jgi:menaquinone-dependent protoporphyrinogen oxidase